MKHCEICSCDVNDDEPTVEGAFEAAADGARPARTFQCVHAACLLSWLHIRGSAPPQDKTP